MGEEKKGTINKIVDGIKTVFNRTNIPERLQHRKEERRLRRKMEHEANMEAIEESKEELKEAKKEKIVGKATGKNKKDVLGKLAKGLSNVGKEIGSMASDEKMNKLLGTGNKSTGGIGGQDKINAMLGNKGNSNVGSTDKINSILGGTKNSNVGSTDKINSILGGTSSKEEKEAKIKKMLGR